MTGSRQSTPPGRPEPDPLTPDQRTLLTDFVREVDENGEGYPPILRSRMESAREAAEIILHIADVGGDPEDRDELTRILTAAQLWERGLLQLEDGMVWVLSEENLADWREAGQPGQIWIRWDALAVDQRATAVSLASFLRDLGGGRRRAGRPAGSRLTPKERAAVADLGPDWRSMSWQDGWRHMADRGAWAPDNRSAKDSKARLARATRWARLVDRFDQEREREIRGP